MQLKFDWMLVPENLRRGITVTDTTLEGPKSPRIIYVNAAWLKMTGYGREAIADRTPRMLQGRHTDRAVVGSIATRLSNREVFHGQTWNSRRGGNGPWR
jgi:PAS domain S-box-containing protein